MVVEGVKDGGDEDIVAEIILLHTIVHVQVTSDTYQQLSVVNTADGIYHTIQLAWTYLNTKNWYSPNWWYG